MDRRGAHSFSIEMKSKEYVERISLSDKGSDSVLVEGFLGELAGISLVEDVMLEMRGANGVLRVDVTRDDLKRLFLGRDA